MDFYKLQYFISVSRHLSFTRAAEECHVAQTVISRQIANLEEELGITLFYRNNRQVELTPAGENFYGEAIFLLQYYRGMVERTQKLSIGFEGTLKIGVGPYEPALLRECLGRFAEKYPSIAINCLQFSYGILPFRYNRGLVDLAFSTQKCAQSFSPTISHEAYPARWVVAAHQDHPLWSLPEDQQKRLERVNLIVLEDDYDDAYQRGCKEAGFQPHSVVQTNFLSSQMLMLESKLGVAVLPEFLDFPASVRTMEIGELPFLSPFVSTYNPNNHNPCIIPFLELYATLCGQRH